LSYAPYFRLLDYYWGIALLATALEIDHTSHVLPDQQDADISWLFLYRYGVGHAEWSIGRIHLEP
jgi:hypothetical protein